MCVLLLLVERVTLRVSVSRQMMRCGTTERVSKRPSIVLRNIVYEEKQLLLLAIFVLKESDSERRFFSEEEKRRQHM